MYWKFLRVGATSPFTGFAWPMAGSAWVQTAETDVCRTGIHACRRADLPYWLSDELWGIELAEPVIHSVHKVVAAQARLRDRVESWNPETGRELAEACVARTAQHAADEFREAGLSEAAERLVGQPLGALVGIADELAASFPGRRAERAVELCRYVVDAVEGMPVYPSATIAYIAARAANRRSGPPGSDLYAEEREWQAAWLINRLGLAVVS